MSDKSKRGIKKSDFVIIKWLISIGKSQLDKIAVLIITNAIGAALAVCYASFSKKIIDGAVVDKDLNVVIKYSVFLFILIMVQLILHLVGNSILERCKCRLEMIFKKHMLTEIMKKDYSSISAYHTGELQNRIFNDVNIITDGFSTIIPSLVFFVVKIISAFIYLVVIDKLFAFLLLAVGVIIFVVMRLFRSSLKKLHKKVQETEGRTRSFFQESILNLLVVKSFSVEDKISAEADDLQAANFKVKMKRRLVVIMANAGMHTFFNLGYVFALAFGGVRLLAGSMTYGTVTAMLQLVNQIQTPFANLSSILPKYYALIASGERLHEICGLPEEEELNANPIDAHSIYKELKSISFNNISFKYDREIILDNTSLTVNKGDFIAICGISGIGKSTLLKLLLGVFQVDSGDILLETSNASIPVDKQTRRLFAYVPQGNMLLSGTIKENLTFINSDVTDDEINEAVRISCAKQFIDELPLGLETVIGEKGMGLSEGQLQRLAIARSILSKSPVMLLDEATSALDEATEKQLLTNLQELKNVTCIIVSHKKAALDICNKCVYIENSKIVSEEK